MRLGGLGTGAIFSLLGRLGVPGVVIAIAIVAFLMFTGGGTGIDPGTNSLNPAGRAPAEDPLDPATDPDAELVDFMSFLLDDIQDEWADIFRINGMDYRRAELVLFDAATQSGCGGATEAIGPHYCPLDERVYLDLDFFKDLQSRFGAQGDFAQAYVIAHEIGHHVQNVLGTMGQVQSAQQSGQGDANDLSVRLELQADCFAGVWGFSVFQRDLLESGDLQEAINAAGAVGDDRIQEATTGRVNPENFTHGTSEQRIEWFRRGFEEGDPAACDTFSGNI